MGHQGQEAFQQQHPIGSRKAIPQPQLAGEAIEQLLDGARVFGLAHQVVHRRQGAEPLPQGQAPGLVADLAFYRGLQGVAEPELGLLGDVGRSAGGVIGIELGFRLLPGQRQGIEPLRSIGGVRCEELLGAEPFFFDQGGGLKAAGEDLGGIAEHRLPRVGATEGGGGAHTHQLLAGALEAIAQAPDQTGEIGALGAVEGVELVDDEIAKNPCVVVLPEALHMGLDQQVVELLVVGEQDVGRCLMQSVLVGDHAGGGHGRGGRVVGGADVETSAQPGKSGIGVDQIGNAPGLVGGQGIHRVDEDRLDAPLALGVLLAAVLQQRQQEAFRFAGAGAGGHQGVAWCARQQPIKGLFLVEVRREGERDLGEPVAPGALTERQGN